MAMVLWALTASNDSPGWNGLPQQLDADAAVYICAEQLLKAAAQQGKLTLDPVHGHGMDWDRFVERCRLDPKAHVRE